MAEEKEPPPWRTGDVIAMCRGMLQTKDFAALPFLADALQDGDFADEAVLAECRLGLPNQAGAERLVLQLYSDETAAAVAAVDGVVAEFDRQWVARIADEIGGSAEDTDFDDRVEETILSHGVAETMTYDLLMAAADRFLAEGAQTVAKNYFQAWCWQAVFEGDVAKTFWAAYEVIRGTGPILQYQARQGYVFEEGTEFWEYGRFFDCPC